MTWKTHQIVSRICKGIRDGLEPQLPVPNTFTWSNTEPDLLLKHGSALALSSFSVFWPHGKPALSKQQWGNRPLLKRLRIPCWAWVCWGAAAHGPEGNQRMAPSAAEEQMGLCEVVHLLLPDSPAGALGLYTCCSCRATAWMQKLAPPWVIQKDVVSSWPVLVWADSSFLCVTGPTLYKLSIKSVQQTWA